MTKFDMARTKWTHAHILKRLGMRESSLIIRNAWFTSHELVEDNLPFLTDQCLELPYKKDKK